MGHADGVTVPCGRPAVTATCATGQTRESSGDLLRSHLYRPGNDIGEMNMRCNKIAVGIAAALVLGMAGNAAVAAESVWRDRPSYLLTGKPDPALQALLREPANANYRLIDVDAAQVDSDQKALGFEVFPGYRVEASLLEAYRTESGSTVWHGILDSSPLLRQQHDPNEVTDDPLNNVTIVRDGNTLTGNLRVGGVLYQLRPLKNGSHVLIETNEALAPPDHPAEYADLLKSAVTPMKAPAAAPKANTVIRVMVHATTAAINASGNMSSLIDLAVAEANQSYANSGVSITLQLAGKYSIAYTESGSFSTDLSRYRGTSDGYMDSIHSTRNSISADVGVLIINNSSSCGLASGIGSSASTAFAAAHWSCATGYYSFGHEIGHLQSARHDPANDPTNTPYAYGHGYQYASGGWRTIMAYACSSGCTRINYWSSPLKTYGGVPMGTASRNDNARVLNNTRTTIAGFR